MRIFLGYQGFFEFFTETGKPKKVKLGESLSKAGFFSSNEKIDLAVPSNSTRGRTFFKEFYNTQVASLPFGSDYDCFAETTCQYNVIQDVDSVLYFMNYNSPSGATGALFISLIDDILYQTVWNKPDLEGPGKIFADDVIFDLGKGGFFKGKDQLISLGDEWKAKESDLDIPESATWFAGNMDFVGRFLGGLFFVQKSRQDRLADDRYNRPLTGDRFGGFELDKDFIGQVTIQTSQDQIFTYPIQDDERTNWKKSDYEVFFAELDKNIRDGILFAGGTVDFVKTSGLASTLRDAEYVYEVTYQLPGFENKINLRFITYRESPYSYVSVAYLQSYQEQINDIRFLGYKTSIGNIDLGDPIVLNEIEVEDGLATAEIFGQKLRVDYLRDVTLTTVTAKGPATSTTKVESMSAIDVEDKRLYLEKNCTSDDCQYELVAFSFSRFASEKSGINVCNGIEIYYGMSLVEFKEQSLNSGCRVNTSEAQVGSPNKSTFYIPEDQIALYFNGENNTSLSRLLIYKGEE